VNRREFITLLGGAAVAWPLAARAQQSERVRRIGVLMPLTADDADEQTLMPIFVQGVQQLGWTEGRNLRIDFRGAGANPDDSRKYAAELVAPRPTSSYPLAA
jgi:putative ABC transport system substrate-binding protein